MAEPDGGKVQPSLPLAAQELLFAFRRHYSEETDPVAQAKAEALWHVDSQITRLSAVLAQGAWNADFRAAAVDPDSLGSRQFEALAMPLTERELASFRSALQTLTAWRSELETSDPPKLELIVHAMRLVSYLADVHTSMTERLRAPEMDDAAAREKQSWKAARTAKRVGLSNKGKRSVLSKSALTALRGRAEVVLREIERRGMGAPKNLEEAAIRVATAVSSQRSKTGHVSTKRMFEACPELKAKLQDALKRAGKT